jgi:hypothetical protein
MKNLPNGVYILKIKEAELIKLKKPKNGKPKRNNKNK